MQVQMNPAPVAPRGEPDIEARDDPQLRRLRDTIPNELAAAQNRARAPVAACDTQTSHTDGGQVAVLQAMDQGSRRLDENRYDNHAGRSTNTSTVPQPSSVASMRDGNVLASQPESYRTVDSTSWCLPGPLGARARPSADFQRQGGVVATYGSLDPVGQGATGPRQATSFRAALGDSSEGHGSGDIVPVTIERGNKDAAAMIEFARSQNKRQRTNRTGSRSLQEGGLEGVTLVHKPRPASGAIHGNADPATITRPSITGQDGPVFVPDSGCGLVNRGVRETGPSARFFPRDVRSGQYDDARHGEGFKNARRNAAMLEPITLDSKAAKSIGMKDVAHTAGAMYETPVDYLPFGRLLHAARTMVQDIANELGFSSQQVDVVGLGKRSASDTGGALPPNLAYGNPPEQNASINSGARGIFYS